MVVPGLLGLAAATGVRGGVDGGAAVVAEVVGVRAAAALRGGTAGRVRAQGHPGQSHPLSLHDQGDHLQREEVMMEDR